MANPLSLSASGAMNRRPVPVLLVWVFAALIALSLSWHYRGRVAEWFSAGRSAGQDATPTDDVRARAPQSVVQPEPIGTDSSVSPEPRRLLLTGTRRGANALSGYADLGVAASSPQTYAAGAILVNGARLAEIHPDFVILEKGTSRTRVYVEGKAPPGYVPDDAALSMVGGAAIVTPASVDSADRLADIMHMTPTFTGDAVDGLQVLDSQNPQVLKNIGLQRGDRITDIEGQPVTDMGVAANALRPVLDGKDIVVTVVRDGAPQTLYLNGRVVPTDSARAR